MRRRQVIPWFMLLLLGCGSSNRDWIAEINGKRLPAAEFRRIVEARYQENPEAPRREILNQALNRYISDHVVLARARTQGIRVSTEEARALLVELHGSETHLDGQQIERARIEMTIERTALVDLVDRIRVSESALLHYFEANRDRYRLPERVRIRQIVVEDEPKAQHLLQALDRGADFATLAEQSSLAPEAQEGGSLPPFARGEMPEIFDQAFELEVGHHSGILESPYGYHLFYLEDRIPAREPSLDAMQSRVRSELEQKKLSELKNEWRRGLLRSAQIRINDALVETLR